MPGAGSLLLLSGNVQLKLQIGYWVVNLQEEKPPLLRGVLRREVGGGGKRRKRGGGKGKRRTGSLSVEKAELLPRPAPTPQLDLLPRAVLLSRTAGSAWRCGFPNCTSLRAVHTREHYLKGPRYPQDLAWLLSPPPVPNSVLFGLTDRQHCAQSGL